MNRLNNFMVFHENYRSVLGRLEAYMHIAEEGEVIVLTGPSRSGKSTIVKDAVKAVLGRSEGNENCAPNFIQLNATNAGRNGTFDTKHFMKSMLRAVHHPFYSEGEIDPKVDPYVIESNRRTTEQHFREALERAISALKIRFIIIDEAHHAAYASSEAAGGVRVLDSWKTLVSDTSTVLILVGAYPLLPIISRSTHMIGRKLQIHFPRYRENEQDIREFSRVLMRFEERMDYLPTGFLVKNLQHLHENSLGCVGLLSAWLRRFNALQLLDPRSKPTLEKLLDVKLSRADLDEIFKEIAAGEELIDSEESTAESRKPRNRSTGKVKPFKKKARRIKSGGRS